MLTTLSLSLLAAILPIGGFAQAPPPAASPSFPAKGDNGEMGGIFGMGQISLAGGLPKGVSIGGFPNGPEFPKPGARFTSKSILASCLMRWGSGSSLLFGWWIGGILWMEGFWAG